MGRFQDSIEIPPATSMDEAIHSLYSIFEEDTKFEIESVDESPGEIIIYAKAKPNLFSWGEDVWVQINPTEITVISENNSQIIDWNQPQKNVKTIINAVRNKLYETKNPA